MTYTTNAKEVLKDGQHFADCIDEVAAKLVADAMNVVHGHNARKRR